MSLNVQNLTLQRGNRVLVQAFNMLVAQGEGVSLMGPNGSGKTTLLRALAGFHVPRSGQIIRPNSEEPPASISFLGHLDPIKAGQKLGDQLLFWAHVAGCDPKDIATIVERVGLTRQLSLQGGVLSAGQRRRASLGRLLIEARPIWLLDEPSAPLDQAGRELLGQLLDAHRANGGLFVAAVHDELPGGATRTIRLGAS